MIAYALILIYKFNHQVKLFFFRYTTVYACLHMFVYSSCYQFVNFIVLMGKSNKIFRLLNFKYIIK